jgi:hypothetical protein
VYSNSVPHWILRDHIPVEVEDPLVWAQFFEDMENRRVAETLIGSARISTVFLGLDHNFGGEGPPLLFESMIFEGPEDLNEREVRYATWDEATAGHQELVQIVSERLGIISKPSKSLVARIAKKVVFAENHRVPKPSLTAWDRITRDDDDDDL